MSFTRTDMLYNGQGYYQWTAAEDSDNPYYRNGRDAKYIDKTQGYEVLYFLNHLGKKLWTAPINIATYQKMEKMLRYDVPGYSSHQEAEDFIVNNWKKY